MTDAPIGWRLSWNIFPRKLTSAYVPPMQVANYRTRAEALAHKARLEANVQNADLVLVVAPIFLDPRTRGRRRVADEAAAAPSPPEGNKS